MSTTNDDHMMYGSWDMVFNRQNLSSFWTILCPFTEKSKFWKKKPGDIVTLHLCTTNDNHMIYGSLDIRCNGQSFLWTIFFPFDPPKNLENQNFDKMKKKKKRNTGDIIICTINAKMKIIWSMVPEIGSVTDWIFSHFRPFFALLLH